MGKESVTLAVDAANLARNLFGIVPFPLAVLDSNATIILANAAFRSAFPDQKSVRDVPHHDVEVGGERYDFDVMPLQNGLSLFVGREVTEERRLRDRLERAETSVPLGRSIPHLIGELQRPLADIARDLAGLRPPDPASADRAAGLERDLGWATQIAGGLAGLCADPARPQESLDLGSAVRRVIDGNPPSVPVRCEVPEHVPAVPGVPGDLDYVLSTILRNAEDWAARSGAAPVEVRLSTAGSVVRVDTRVGSRDPGGQEGRPPASPGGEEMRGIRVATEIVRKIGGRIDVVPGEAFHVVLEIPAVAKSRDMGSRVRTLHGAALVDKSIMVVDDEIVITSLIEEFLSRCGACVEMFNSSADAYGRLAEKARYDAIICDQRMPGVSGESLYRRVEALDPGQARRFVFVTGNALDENARRFFARTRTRYILKPFSLGDLYTAVSAAVKQPPEERS